MIEISRGQPWDRDDRDLNLKAKNNFFKPLEQYEDNRNGVNGSPCLRIG